MNFCIFTPMHPMWVLLTLCFVCRDARTNGGRPRRAFREVGRWFGGTLVPRFPLGKSRSSSKRHLHKKRSLVSDLAIMTTRTPLSSAFTTAVLAVLASFGGGLTVSANDYGDSPTVAQDAAADIGDVYLFKDPGDGSQVVMIATVRGFIVPGQLSNVAAFDENIRYRFQVYNDHVNFVSPLFDPNANTARKNNFIKTIKPSRFIDITFGKRSVGPAPQDSIPANLRRPLPQAATVTFTGFKGISKKGFKFDVNEEGLQTTPADTSGPAADFVVSTIQLDATNTANFFAGVVDDPAFFDLPAFVSYVDGVRETGTPDKNAFTRQRDTFAGYNTLAIALRLPSALLRGDEFQFFLGLEVLTQRRGVERNSANGAKGAGGFRTIDRMGTPLANLAFSPFDGKNAYNGGTPMGDGKLYATSPLLQTLSELGVTDSNALRDLQDLYVAYGDLLQLDTTAGSASFPVAGRRPADDVMDYILTRLNNGTALGDGVNSGGSLATEFPYLGKPNQPLPSNAPEVTRN